MTKYIYMLHACGNWKIEEWWKKKKVACVWELEDRRMMKVIIIIIRRHALYMECVSVMVVVFGKIWEITMYDKRGEVQIS